MNIKLILGLFLCSFNGFRAADAQQINSTKPLGLQLSYPLFETEFIWQGGLRGNKWDDYAALLIPVTVRNSTRVFYMQFDTGSPVSLLYDDKLKEIKALMNRSGNTSDTLQKTMNFNFKIGNTEISAREISVVKRTQIEDKTIDTTARQIIGTIGTDTINGNVLLIDYLERKIVVIDKIPESILKSTKLSDFFYTMGSILLPSILQKENKILYFDTGSSAFELLIDKLTWQNLANKDSIPLSYKVQSWNRTLTANTVATRDSIQISTQKIPLRYVTFIEGASDNQINRMMALGIGGMTGNKLFLNTILVIDTKNKKFGVVRK
ncbi:MAG: hypothetical protein H7Z72_22095 [Bacteroidetes bacterium]|nr:hypothetical protein [Fibrella sp.]